VSFMKWKPLLSGQDAEQTEQAIGDLAEALQQSPPDIHGHSLSTGHTGVALFFAYLSLARSDERLADLASEHLSHAIDSVALEESPNLSLFTGLSGLAWVWQHLNRILYCDPSAGETEELDEAILDAVRGQPWQFEWDLVFGLTGIGLYALNHPERTFAAEVAGEVVARLGEIAVQTQTGIAWKTQPEFLTAKGARSYPEGRFDQGVAHGVPGVIGFLAACYESGIVRDQSRQILEQALAWLLANVRPEDGGSRFTYFPPEMVDARSGWCYGDPGVSSVLFRVSEALGDLSGRDFAISIASRAARRPIEATGVVDATLCHGAAGLGHIYNRLFQATGEADLGEAAKTWFEKALALREPGKGIGGYSNWWPEIAAWRGESGFLVGSAGIGLALLSSIYSIEPLWDTPLLLAHLAEIKEPKHDPARR
jgi:lantibiotic modifying enzyme